MNHFPEGHKNGINANGFKPMFAGLNTMLINREYVVAGLSDLIRLGVYCLATRHSKYTIF
jgi:hypothetical protein